MAFGIGTSFNAGEGDEEYTRENTHGENSSDMSSDPEAGEVIRALEPNVSRSGKRTYGVPVEDMLIERRRKNAKLDEQLAILQSILPSSRENNPASKGKGAFPPNAQVGGQTTDIGSTNHVLYEHPQVEVKRVNGRLELCIACVNRPGLLIDILAALDSKSISVMQGSIMCCENVSFRAFSLEKETMLLHAGPECLPLEAEEEAVKELIFRAIRQDLSENDPK
ncbi:transcription factor bHLH61 isoform X2 [Physcomitrium patens]|uniref:Plant bHLH transcription factor ACT-like domain-containing protein n=1 Tax=Physcomitrium patens TaxID=3218 RepID=A0A2K1KF69_PHYPA|nr:uncharacterized protein LOC112283402 isoform X2 [Physcomitrium patens]PNR52423.1 hypothetical protein PHYPA_008797 [Physcomitrium patens]|eukprot:XP_024377793.1 uncharacterized protein LOC112283402 isoform X2 [Physcomitrella patens]